MGQRTETTIEERIDRLSTASLKRVVEPDVDVPGEVGPGQILPDELLSVAGLNPDLTPGQRAVLSREEVASITAAGIRFESILAAGFSMQILRNRDLTDPQVTYILHELGEETRHSRLFVRLLSQLRPKARNPLEPFFRVMQRIVLPFLLRRPAFFCVLVLTGEEVPDLFQKRTAEHPDTDPFVREINRYHRAEEARHLAFARMILPGLWKEAGFLERFLVRRFAPFMVGGMVDTLVHPGVYETVGLPGFATWRAANRSPERLAFKQEALGAVLGALLDAGVLKRGRIPARWQEICGVDANGEPGGQD
jgi:hypothetical protein